MAQEEEVRQRESTVPTGPSALASPQTSGLSLGFQLQNKQRGRCPDDGFERLEKQESLPRVRHRAGLGPKTLECTHVPTTVLHHVSVAWASGPQEVVENEGTSIFSPLYIEFSFMILEQCA